jgi:ATP-dependent Clp protease ATP-binding subunit ClpC
MFERYTESARRALFFSRYEVSELGAVSIEAEHLLLGVLRETKGVVGRILAESNISAEDVRREVAGRSRLREKVATSVEIPFAEPTRRALNFAAEEADLLKHTYIGPEHLLLGLLRLEDSSATATLQAHGMRLDAVRSAVLRYTAEAPGDLHGDSAMVAEIDQLAALVDQLTSAPANSSEGDVLARRIYEGLDRLRRHFGR